MFIKIRKILIFSLILLLISIDTGCDYCGGGGSNGLPQTGDIYFTAIPVNSIQPGIFWIQIGGTNSVMQQVIGNTHIYSAPSKDNKIVFTRDYLNSKMICISNIDGSNIRAIFDDNFAGDKLYPILSPNGKYIAVNDIRTGLWLVKNETEIFQLSNDFCQNPSGTWWRCYSAGFAINSY